MANTKIHYLYRDAANYKQGHEIVVAGSLTFDELQPYLDEGEYFCPDDVELPHPGEKWRDGYKYPTDDDHCWCELDGDGIEASNDPATDGLTAAELLRRFREASEAGWPSSLVQQ